MFANGKWVSSICFYKIWARKEITSKSCRSITYDVIVFIFAGTTFEEPIGEYTYFSLYLFHSLL